MQDDVLTLHFESVAELHQAAGISKPRHPLFSICRLEDFPPVGNTARLKLIPHFYQITLKTECPCKMQYGQTSFDFDEGVISCFAPKQVSIIDPDFTYARAGWVICIHPDFLRGFPLDRKIKTMGFFDYEVNEALILSEEEQESVELIFRQIEKEYRLPMDQFSQDVLISAVDLLLTHCNRYYGRQFLTRKVKNQELLSRVEAMLNKCFNECEGQGLPTPASIASQMNLSTKYLSDCLKQLTGQTTQQMIHDKLIECAKEKLTTTGLSISEIAYQLGFSYPQSFNKLFKNKTQHTPLEFRSSFN